MPDIKFELVSEHNIAEAIKIQAELFPGATGLRCARLWIQKLADFALFCRGFVNIDELQRTSQNYSMVDRGGFEPPYALAGRFTVCCH